jgi:molybdenum cofactor cytidylyltransferase
MPGVTASLVERLNSAFDPEAGAAICVAGWRGRRGNPVLWARRFFGEMSMLSGDAGARSLIERHGAQVRVVEGDDDGPVKDIDTPADLIQAE